jgi:hypothetical protein
MMNEQIKKLAEQCWNNRPEGQLHFDNEKFAELIVRESAEMLACEYGQSATSGNEAAIFLKKHFGVE